MLGESVVCNVSLFLQNNGWSPERLNPSPIPPANVAYAGPGETSC